MSFSTRFFALLLVIGRLACTFAVVVAPFISPSPTYAQTAAGADRALSATAESVYAAARPRLLQVRTLVGVGGPQTSIGSGFLVDRGLAITNYHVVSQFALEPQTFRLEYAAADGRTGPLRLLAIDIANDLAVVRLDDDGASFFAFDARALDGTVPKGERLYSMGNPLDLGFTIVEGTYNGPVDRSYNERIHFSGAINPGMSGGPTVTAEGRIVGINVAKQLSGELVSFLVPARFAAALLHRAQAADAPPLTDVRGEITRQLTHWQAGLYQTIAEMGFRKQSFGPYEAPESVAPWFTCWARTNADRVPKPRALYNTSDCRSDTHLFIANDLTTGHIQLAHTYARSVDLNAFQFATFLSQYYRPGSGGWTQKWYTPPRCQEDFVRVVREENPPLRAVWCARGYRELAGLYDISVVVVTQDRDTEALISRLDLQGITYENALVLGRRFIEALQWTR